MSAMFSPLDEMIAGALGRWVVPGATRLQYIAQETHCSGDLWPAHSDAVRTSDPAPERFEPADEMRRICRWLIRFNVAPSDLLMQRGQKQIQPTDLKTKAVGAVIRELRKRAARSQERLSDSCGFDRTYISRVERGIISP